MKRKRSNSDDSTSYEPTSNTSTLSSTISNAISNTIAKLKTSLFSTQPEALSSDMNIVMHEPQRQPTAGNNFFEFMPNEIMYGIFQNLPLDPCLRLVNKRFNIIWEWAAKTQLTNSNPSFRLLGRDKVFEKLMTEQVAEIKLLTDSEYFLFSTASKDNKYKLRQLLKNLTDLQDNPSMSAYHTREKYLNDINAFIIRDLIKIRTKRDLGKISLNLICCSLTRFPDELFTDKTLQQFWSEITEIEISFNKLKVLPEGIGECAALEVLSVSNNKLTSLPDSIGNCTKLKEINARNNNIAFLPDSIRKCISLKFLFVDKNQISSLPNSIGQCTELVALYADYNEIISLPDSLGQCTKLLDINIKCNKLISLPDSLTQCTELITLNAYDNNIIFLSDSVGQWAEQLIRLYITKNNFNKLPDNLPLCNEAGHYIDKVYCLGLQKKPFVENEAENQNQNQNQKQIRLH